MSHPMTAALLQAAARLATQPSAVSTLPAGLTEEDVARISAAIAAARTESTRHVYALNWGHWERWCATRDITALPADPLALCAYLTERAEAGRAMSTLDMSCTVIRQVHRALELDGPVSSEVVGQVRRGLRRTYGATPRRLARPLSADEIRRILATIDRTTTIGIRDAAMILLGYASALRRSEIVALTFADIEYKPGGVLLTIRQSKMDQEGDGALVAVAQGRQPATDPVAALRAWQELRGDKPGALFTRLWASTVSLQPLAGRVVARTLRSRAEAAGLDATRALAGVPLDRIAAQTRHKDLTVLVNRYIRPLETLANTSSTSLGL